MSTLASYRRLFELVGVGYVVAAFIARVPLAMSQIGTLLLVAGATGSYGTGGAAAGALAVANAIGAPFAGSLADRHGQRVVVGIQSALGAVGLVGIVVATNDGAATPIVLLIAAAAGLALPQVGPLARVRWRPATTNERHQHRLIATAFSYEGAADEASFVLGPLLVGLIAALIDPAGALIAAAAMLAVFGTVFALHRTAPAGTPRRHGASAAPLVTAALAVAMAAQFLIGSIFGSIQTGSTVLATAAGHPGAAGLIHALLGIGSVAAALSYAALPDRFTLPARLLVSAVALALFSAPLLLVGSLKGVIAVTLVLGFAVAPFMITNFSLAERVVPPVRVATAMTLLAAVTGLGYAAGSALAGHLADVAKAGDTVFGMTGVDAHTAAYLVTVTSGVAALVVALIGWRPLTHALASATESDRPLPGIASDLVAGASSDVPATRAAVVPGQPADTGSDDTPRRKAPETRHATPAG